jgi:hypothetical protein
MIHIHRPRGRGSSRCQRGGCRGTGGWRFRGPGRRLAGTAVIVSMALVIAPMIIFAGAASASPALSGPTAGPSASSAWTIQSTPNPTAGVQSFLQGVSCSSASACTAVGYYENSSLEPFAFAERWNGASWAIQAIPNPAGSTGSYLYGVSCASASACTAVGYYSSDSASLNTLAERWNGTSWAVQTTPKLTALGQLYGVSCTSASACTAVGQYFQTSSGDYLTLAERWNGASWAAQTTPNPADSTGPRLQGVSCASASACTAVGYYQKGTDFLTLGEGWNGKTWSIKATPNPAGSIGSYLYGASCTSSSACTSAGYYARSTEAEATLAERWDGTSWSIQTSPNPVRADGGALDLTGVSCTSSSACTAAGWYEAPSGVEMTLALAWNGKSWAIQATPNRTGSSGNYLNGVSCTSSSACTAVGYYTTSSGYDTLAERE